jgi:hypothetical protein
MKYRMIIIFLSVSRFDKNAGANIWGNHNTFIPINANNSNNFETAIPAKGNTLSLRGNGEKYRSRRSMIPDLYTSKRFWGG